MVLVEDLKIIAKKIRNENIKNANIVITGSTGLLGSLLVKSFLMANTLYNLNNVVYSFARNVKKARSVFIEYDGNQFLKIFKCDNNTPIYLNDKIDYIFHFAAVTNSKDMIQCPVELMDSTYAGIANILRFARDNQVGSIVYISSMEVFGVIDKETPLKEVDLGWLDLTKIRNCYPESKRFAELYCKCFADEFGVNVKIARLTQTFGAGAKYDESRLFGMVARNVIENKNIELSTAGESARDYCYTTDALNAIITIATRGELGETYNVSNNKTYKSILEMCRMVAEEIALNEIDVVVPQLITESSKCFAANSQIKLDTTKLENLGWKPQFDLKDMYCRLIQSYREVKK